MYFVVPLSLLFFLLVPAVRSVISFSLRQGWADDFQDQMLLLEEMLGLEDEVADVRLHWLKCVLGEG